MRRLESVLLVCLTLAPLTAFADTHVVRGDRMLEVPSAYATPASPYHGLFLRLRHKAAGADFAFANELERVRYFRGEKPLAIVAGEGCAKHPMEWLYNARAIGWFSKSLPNALLIQVPEGAKIVAQPKSAPTCADALLQASVVKAVTVLRSGDEELAYVVCSGDPNARLHILRRTDSAWAPVDALTVEERCP